jgi:hypothetical protein
MRIRTLEIILTLLSKFDTILFCGLQQILQDRFHYGFV